MNKQKYIIDSSDIATEIYSENRILKSDLFKEFSNMITSPNLKDALYLPDQNELGQYKDGITTFGVITDKSLYVLVHENNYLICKDEMAALKQMVSRAQELLNKDTHIEILNDDSKLSLS